MFCGQLVAGYAGQQRRLYDPYQYTFLQHLQPLNRWTSYFGVHRSASSQLTLRRQLLPELFAGQEGRGEPVGGRHARVDAALAARRTTTSTSSRRCVRGPHEYANPEVKKALGRDWIGQTEELPKSGKAPELSRRPRPASADTGAPASLARYNWKLLPMGAIVPYPPPRARQEWTAYLGMVIFLGSWAMMFGSLFFAYGMVRARSDAWPPPDLPELPLGLPGLQHGSARREQRPLAAWGAMAAQRQGVVRRSGGGGEPRPGHLVRFVASGHLAQPARRRAHAERRTLSVRLLRADLLSRAARGRRPRGARVDLPRRLRRQIHGGALSPGAALDPLLAFRRSGVWGVMFVAVYVL